MAFIKRFSALIVLIVFALIISIYVGQFSAFAQTNAYMTVDFAIPRPDRKSMSGIVHGMDASFPATDLIAPLKPKLWRTGTLASKVSPRAMSLGSRVTIVCSDIWGYSAANAPYNNYPAFEARMREIAIQSGSQPVIFDIWNEPNGPEFWHGSTAQFYETFRRAHNAIRSVRPDAIIAGPSLAGYQYQMTRDFLDYSLANNLRLDVLTWHEFRGGYGIASIESSLIEARQDFVENPAYKNLHIAEIHLNEAINEDTMLRPASTLAIFDRMERGRADHAARACWNESNGQNNCWTNTLNGLLTMNTRKPRAIWWAYKAYAEGAGRRVNASTGNSRTFVLPSASATADGSVEPAQIIVGAYKTLVNPLPVSTRISLRNLNSIPYLKGKESVKVSISVIDNEGEAEAANLQLPREFTAPIVNNNAEISLKMRTEAVYVIKMLPL